jgi:plasmid replication initiation protein
VTSRRYIDSQFDLFILNITDFALHDQRETMERPFFSLAKRKRIKPNENDGIWVKVKPHQNYGMTTIWDADIMIWAASAIVSMKNKGINDIPDELHFHPFDVLKAIRRQTGGDQYQRLREALDRLKSTVRARPKKNRARSRSCKFLAWPTMSRSAAPSQLRWSISPPLSSSLGGS